MNKAKEKIIEYLEERNNLDFIDNHSIWECEERMCADHFATHSTIGIRSHHVPMRVISVKEIIEINKRVI